MNFITFLACTSTVFAFIDNIVTGFFDAASVSQWLKYLLIFVATSGVTTGAFLNEKNYSENRNTKKRKKIIIKLYYIKVFY